MYPRILSLIAAALLFSSLAAESRVIHVPADSTTVQSGINGAVDGDTVMVAPGTYVVYWLEYHGKAIRVTSTNPLDSAVVAGTVLDGSGGGPMIFIHEQEDSNSVLTGFTITNGYSTGWGGGVFCFDSSPAILRNVITGNHAHSGGGIGCSYYASPIIRENIIVGNSADYHGGGIATMILSSPRIIRNTISDNWNEFGNGGGINLYSGSGVISGNTVTRNTAAYSGGGIEIGQEENTIIVTSNVITENHCGLGGGISADRGFPTISDNMISGNVAEAGSGGGLYVDVNGGIISGNDISGNHADVSGGGIATGGIFNEARFQNNQVVGNTAEYGGGIACDSRYPATFLHNTVVGNTAISAGGGIRTGESIETIRNTIFWGNKAPVGREIWIGSADPGAFSIDHSLVDGGLASVYEEIYDVLVWGEGNINADPGFVKPGSGDYHLGPESPCVDAGVYAGVASDFEGDPRPVGYEVDIGDDESPYSVPYRLILTPTGSLTISGGDTLEFDVYVQNHTDAPVSGDFWVIVMLPNSTEVLAPEQVLDHQNPVEGTVDAHSSIYFFYEARVPVAVETGPYRMIGRIGTFPGLIVDEDTFEFEVIP